MHTICVICIVALKQKAVYTMLVHVLREYNINKILLSYLGLWPLQSKLVKNLLPTCYFVFQMTCYPLEILMLYDNWKNMQLVFESCYHLVLITIFVGKLVNEFWHHDKIRYLYKTMEDHWNIFTSELEVRILKDYSVISRKFAIYYSTIMYSMLMIFLIIPLTPIFLDIVRPLNESRPRFFVIPVEYRIDKNRYFVPLFCYNVGIIVTGAMIMVSVDTMHVNCITHASSLFSIIGQQFEEIERSLEEIISKVNVKEIDSCGCYVSAELELSNEEVIYQKYIICLQKYQLAIEFVSVLNSMFRAMALFLLLLTGATISLVGIRIVYVLDQLQEVMRFSFIIIAMLIQLMILCYSSQKLMDESQRVFYRAYAAEWYKFSPRLKSLLIMTLRRSIVPCSLTAGNMFPLSMMTFGLVVRTALSYFMTFLSLKD